MGERHTATVCCRTHPDSAFPAHAPLRLTRSKRGDPLLRNYAGWIIVVMRRVIVCVHKNTTENTNLHAVRRAVLSSRSGTVPSSYFSTEGKPSQSLYTFWPMGLERYQHALPFYGTGSITKMKYRAYGGRKKAYMHFLDSLAEKSTGERTSQHEEAL